MDLDVRSSDSSVISLFGKIDGEINCCCLPVKETSRGSPIDVGCSAAVRLRSASNAYIISIDQLPQTAVWDLSIQSYGGESCCCGVVADAFDVAFASPAPPPPWWWWWWCWWCCPLWWWWCWWCWPEPPVCCEGIPLDEEVGDSGPLFSVLPPLLLLSWGACCRGEVCWRWRKKWVPTRPKNPISSSSSTSASESPDRSEDRCFCCCCCCCCGCCCCLLFPPLPPPPPPPPCCCWCVWKG